jgi:hypothetical protein
MKAQGAAGCPIGLSHPGLVSIGICVLPAVGGNTTSFRGTNHVHGPTEIGTFLTLFVSFDSAITPPASAVARTENSPGYCGAVSSQLQVPDVAPAGSPPLTLQSNAGLTGGA